MWRRWSAWECTHLLFVVILCRGTGGRTACVKNSALADNQPAYELMNSLNAAAARLQGAALARADVFDAFVGELRDLGLRGGIHLLQPDGKTLQVASVAIAPRLVKALEGLTGLKIQGYEFAAQEVAVFRDALESREAVFVADSRSVVVELLPKKARRFLRKIVELLGSQAGVYAPLIAGGRTYGVLSIESPGFEREQLPVVQAFANHLAVALQNADLVAELVASEEMAQNTLDALAANIAVLDGDGVILAVNKAWVEFGQQNQLASPADGIGVNYLAVCDAVRGEEQPVAQEIAAGIRQMIKGKRTAVEVTYPCHSPTEKRWFVARVTRFAGKPLRIVVAHHDVTERLEAEERRREAENQLRLMVNTVRAAVFIYDSVHGRLAFANPELERLSGYSAQELTRMQVEELMHPEDRRSRQERQQTSQRDAAVSPQMELRLLTKGGEVRWLELTISPIEYDGRRALLGTAFDITDRKLAQASLEESEERFRTLVESISAAAFMFRGTQMVFANRRAEELTGYSRAELLKKAFWELVHPDMQDLVKERGMARQQGADVPSRYEVKLQTKSGEVRWVEFTGTVIEVDGERAVLGTAFEITQRKQAEAALQESEERFRLAFENSPDGIHINRLDDGRYVYVNRGFSEITGYSAEEALGRTSKAMKIWVDYADRQKLVEQLELHGAVENFEARFRTKSGEILNGLLSASIIEWGGEPHVFYVEKNVNALVQAQNALAETEERFRALVQHATEAIVILDVETEKFVEANPMAEALYGLPRAELLGRGPIDLSPENQPDGRPSAKAARGYLKQALAGQLPVFEWLHTSADGREVLCEVRLVRLPGKAALLRGTVTDITARASIEQQLRVQSKALEAAAEAMVMTDAEGAITWVNPAFTRLTGYLPEEAVGRQATILQSAETRPEVIEELWNTIRAGAIWQGEMVNQRKDGSTYIEQQTITPVFNDQSRISHFISIKRDVTARRQRERLLQAVAQVSQALRLAESHQEITELVIDQVADLLEADAVSLTLLDSEQGDYVLEAAHGRWAHYIGTRFKPGESVTGLIIQNPQTFINNDLQNAPDGRFTRPEMWAGMTAAMALPLEAHGVVLGVLWVGRGKPFQTDDEHVLEAIANIAASALHRSELHETTEKLFDETRAVALELAQQVGELERAKEEINRRNLELSRLYRASESLLTGHTPNRRELADQVVRSVLEEFGKSNCSVILVRAGERELERVAVGGEYAAEVRQGRLFVDGKGLAPRAIQQAKTINVGDVRQMAEYIPNWQAARSEIAIPLKIGELALGVIDIQSADTDAFTEEDERVLGLFAERAALALENARLFEDAQLHLGQLQALRDIDIAITSSLDIQLTLKVLLDQVLVQLKADAASVLLFQGGALVYSAGRGFHTREIEKTLLRMGEGFAGRAALERKLMQVPDIEAVQGIAIEGELWRREGLRAYFGAPLVAKGEVLGVLEIFQRTPFEPSADWVSFLLALAEQAAIAVSNAELFDRLQRAKTELEVAYSNTLRGWVHALDLRDKETEGHTQRVTELTARLAVLMGLSPDELQHVTRGALLHDIGKMAIPDGVLLKPGPLTPEERALIEKHADYARQFLEGIDYLKPALDIPYCHHERWDGSGYPRGLKGTEIPLTARIFAVVDVWDALTSDRPYRKAWSREQTIQYLRAEAGRLFDPQVVARFVDDVLLEDKARAN